MPGCNLARAPRPVPLLVCSQVLFGDMLTQFGWFFFGFGMIFFWAFAMNSDLASIRSFRGPLETTPGIVTDSRGMGASENGAEVYAYHYSFTGPDGIKYEGVSYSLGSRMNKGHMATIEFPKGGPAKSRIQGMRTAPFGAWAALVTVFPGVGLAFVLAGTWNGAKAIRLLAHGQPALGKFTSKIATNFKVNDRTVYKLTFVFPAEDGYSYETVAKSSMPETLEDGTEKPVLYDPADPRKAVLLDNLQGAPTVDESGRIRAGSAGKAALVLILPMVTIIGHGAYMCVRFFG